MIIFRHLTKDDLKRVIDLELAKVKERLGERGLTLVLTDDAKEFLIRKGSDLDYGARPLRRAIEQYVEDPLSEELLKGEFNGQDMVTVGAIKDDEGKLRRLDFQGSRAAPPPEAVAAGAAAAADDSSEAKSE